MERKGRFLLIFGAILFACYWGHTILQFLLGRDFGLLGWEGRNLWDYVGFLFIGTLIWWGVLIGSVGSSYSSRDGYISRFGSFSRYREYSPMYYGDSLDRDGRDYGPS